MEGKIWRRAWSLPEMATGAIGLANVIDFADRCPFTGKKQAWRS
jgi:hypothetical protein